MCAWANMIDGRTSTRGVPGAGGASGRTTATLGEAGTADMYRVMHTHPGDVRPGAQIGRTARQATAGSRRPARAYSSPTSTM